MTKQLDKDDYKILTYMRNNSRQTLTDMSRETQIPVSTIYERLKGKIKNAIKKKTCILNFDILGMSTRAQMTIKVNPKEKDDVKRFLEKNVFVNSVYKVNNGYDFLVDVIFPSMSKLEDFIEQLEINFKIKKKQIFYVLEEVVQEKFLSLPHELECLSYV